MIATGTRRRAAPVPFQKWKRVNRSFRILAALTLAGLTGLLLAAGCGREAPGEPQTPDAPDTHLFVDSRPQGAAIVLDGADSGEVTPHLFSGLPEGDVEVALDLPSYHVTPATFTIAVTEGDTARVPGDTFTTRSRRLVLLEGFANIDCIPCPELTTNLLNLTGQDGYGPDRVAFAEYAIFFPNFRDPFYQNASTDNEERRNTYTVTAAPALVVDGATQASATDLAAMTAAVDQALLTDPKFLVDVTADLTAADVPVTVTITALEAVDLTGHTLRAALYQDEIDIDEAEAGANGQTEFHHVLVVAETSPPALGAMTAGESTEHEFTLTPAFGNPSYLEWTPGPVEAFAFIQRDADLVILQAGTTAATAAASAALFVPSGTDAQIQSEGNQP